MNVSFEVLLNELWIVDHQPLTAYPRG